MRCIALFALIGLCAGCAQRPTRPPEPPSPSTVSSPSVSAQPEQAASVPADSDETYSPGTMVKLRAAQWPDLPGWYQDSLLAAWPAWLASCTKIGHQSLWNAVCRVALSVPQDDLLAQRRYWEQHFLPWRLMKSDGGERGLVTGYYEPILRGSRKPSARYNEPVFGPPDDLIIVELAQLYPQLKTMRLRGRIQGRKLTPFYSRAQWAEQKVLRKSQALLWVDDPIDLFFMEIQGSGQVELDDGSRIRLGYADQNGHPFRSIGRWLIQNNELASGQASMQNIKRWAASRPQRLSTLLNVNPSLVFFRELPVEGTGPPGALGVPLTPQRSIAIDPTILPLGAPVWLDTTWPNESRPLQQLMLAQDTGGAIKGAIRADFYWGSGNEAGAWAGKMSQGAQQWVIMPRSFRPRVTEPSR
jgi:membrane-bound lytic murein transglycosylase A